MKTYQADLRRRPSTHRRILLRQGHRSRARRPRRTRSGGSASAWPRWGWKAGSNRRSTSSDPRRTPRNYGDTKVIQPGDLLHCDFGIKYLGLCTDMQWQAYVLRPGETDAPGRAPESAGQRQPRRRHPDGRIQGGPDGDGDRRGGHGQGAGRGPEPGASTPIPSASTATPPAARRTPAIPRRSTRSTSRSGAIRSIPTRPIPSNSTAGRPRRNGTTRTSVSVTRRTRSYTAARTAAASSTAARRRCC